jgi:DNA polymerase-3 subunit gamma/tau
MMLYRKYRPQTFGQVVGQEHVVKTLEGALITGRIGHAYLLTGPRGTGKTTLARIFAKSLNCVNYRGVDERRRGNTESSSLNVPCNKCEPCLGANQGNLLDMIEIDAASNRGIEEIRNLKESATVAAIGGGYKVFVIDEVHMLTKDAFNALLKILEEPPAHVVFMLATTEPHKILPTVLSRVQRFDLKRLTPSQILLKLKEVSRAEKIDIEEGALKAIAASADGALRDAEVSLAKVRSVAGAGRITTETAIEALGLIPYNYHPEFFGYLVSNDKVSALNLIQRMHDSGVDLENFTKDFLEYSRKVLMAKINPAVLASVGEELPETPGVLSQLEGKRFIKLIQLFTSARNEMKSSPIAQLPLELAVLEFLDIQ